MYKISIVENELNEDWLSSLHLINEMQGSINKERKEEIKKELERRENSKLVEIK